MNSEFRIRNSELPPARPLKPRRHEGTKKRFSLCLCAFVVDSGDPIYPMARVEFECIGSDWETWNELSRGCC
jgi:hypothetical protein